MWYIYVFSLALHLQLSCTASDSHLWFLLNQPTFSPCQKGSHTAHRQPTAHDPTLNPGLEMTKQSLTALVWSGGPSFGTTLSDPASHIWLLIGHLHLEMYQLVTDVSRLYSYPVSSTVFFNGSLRKKQGLGPHNGYDMDSRIRPSEFEFYPYLLEAPHKPRHIT